VIVSKLIVLLAERQPEQVCLLWIFLPLLMGVMMAVGGRSVTEGSG
jgi:hypothetical protein